MFLLFFLIFILVFTIFENIALASISLALAVIVLIIYQSVSGKKILGKSAFITVSGAFILAGCAFVVKERKYYGTSYLEQGTRTMSQFPGSNSLFVGSGIISDISGQGKYIFSDGNSEFLLRSEKKYTIGDTFRLVGNVQKNEIPSWHSYRTISSGTFAVPIFSGGFDYGKWLKMKGRQGTIYEKNSITNYEGPMKNEAGIIQSMKKSIQEKIIAAYGENKVSGLVLGMLIGDRSQIPEVEYQQFVDSGLVHLIAVSGGNILMIVVFLQFILFFLPFYVRIAIILITITGYSLVCGLDSSVFRAVLMGGLSMVALFRGREINIWRLLSISALIMLIINPYFLAYDTGFLLSYAAIIGLVYFETLKNRKKEILKDGKVKDNNKQSWMLKGGIYVYKNYISPSIGASIGIFPIIIFFMGKINLMGIVGNLFVLPIVPFVMIYGFVSVWLYSFLHRPWILSIEQWIIEYIYKVSEILANNGIFLSVSGLWVKYIFLLGFLTAFILRMKKNRENKGEKPEKTYFCDKNIDNRKLSSGQV